LRRRLLQNSSYVKEALQNAGVALPQTPGPIVPVLCQSESAMASLKRRLLAGGIYPPFVKYPGGPAEGFFRFVISSEHSHGQLDRLLDVLTRRR
jgi:7-keto-8-aminopelargonate synthetase-like enzyme